MLPSSFTLPTAILYLEDPGRSRNSLSREGGSPERCPLYPESHSPAVACGSRHTSCPCRDLGEGGERERERERGREGGRGGGRGGGRERGEGGREGGRERERNVCVMIML